MSQAHVIEVEDAAVPVDVGRPFRSGHLKPHEVDSWTCSSFDGMRRVAVSAHRAPPAASGLPR